MPEQDGEFNTSLNRFWAIALRRRWWILTGAFVISLATIWVSYLLPDRYRSEATIVIARASTSQQYIVPNNTANSMEAVETIKREAL